MSGKFENVPVEDETAILFETVAAFGDFEVLYQKWVWSGITAESIIFTEDDVGTMNDEDLRESVKSSPMVKDPKKEITVSRNRKGFAFVNFNFELLDDDDWAASSDEFDKRVAAAEAMQKRIRERDDARRREKKSDD